MKLLLILLAVAEAYALAPLINNENYLARSYIVKLRSRLLRDEFDKYLKQESDKLLAETSSKSGSYEINFVMKADPSLLVMQMDDAMLEKVRQIIYVAYVEKNSLLVDREIRKYTTRATIPSNNWGLDRINQISPELDGDVSFRGSGADVHIYVIDSGVKQLADFGDRVLNDFDAFAGDGQDYIGHGTSVAEAAAGKMYGVAKDATIHSVRIFNEMGLSPLSEMLKGIDWVTSNLLTPCVALMAFSRQSNSTTMCDAVQRLADAGCVPVAAGTNNNGADDDFDACAHTPANCPDAITVGASTWDDTKATFSRYGMCIDVFAPGDNIQTSVADEESFFQSGTGMAAPLVAGVAAIHLGNGVDSKDVRSQILGDAISCQMSNVGKGSPNRFLYIDPADTE